MKTWLILFFFQGQIQAVGPLDLQDCLLRAEVAPKSHKAVCVNQANPLERKFPEASK